MGQERPVRRARKGTGAVTLHEVARLADVAPITVSRAINTPARVSRQVLERVQEAIAQTGYVPNRLAGGLASARSRLVAAVVPTISGPIFQNTIQALHETLVQHGCQLMLGQSGYADSREDELIDAIVGRRPDGIVLTGVLHSTEGHKRLLASGIPVVETWDLSPTPIDMLVGFSHAEVGHQVARHFHGKGRRHLAAVVGNDERGMRRLTAYCATAREYGLAEVRAVPVPPPTTMRHGRCALRELLLGQPRLDAIFCSSDLLALGVLTEALHQKIRVPDDLAIIGFGDQAFAADTEPALTTVHVNGAAIGHTAARMILDRAEGRPVEHPIVDIGVSIIERGTA